MCVLSLSLFPLKSLSRFEEVGVFISCAYLFCLCGKKKLFKVVVVFLSVVSKSRTAVKCIKICWKKGEDKRKKNSQLFIFRYKRTLLAITTRKKKEYGVLFTATRGTERERWGNHREGESQLSSRRKKYRRHFLKNDITIERRSGKSTTTKRTNKEFKRKTHRWRCEGNGTKNTEYCAKEEILRAVLVLKRRRWIRCWY